MRATAEMQLPVMPPLAPMLARAVHELPLGEGLAYEPKWDGFRCIVFRDGAEIELTSRNEKPLTRYFPELLPLLAEHLPSRCVLDGEIVIMGSKGLNFDALLERIHPAASRVAKLAEATPSSYVGFDLVALGDEDLREVPFGRRRELLEASISAPDRRVACTPVTTDTGQATEWFTRFEGGGFDGLVIKSLELAYRPGERVMAKLKHERTADCVIGGLRRRPDGSVASLLLGLYDANGVLNHVGVAGSLTTQRRRELAALLGDYALSPGQPHPWVGEPPATPGRRPGGESRWSAGRDTDFEPVRPELVCEVAYDHLQGDRFRHGTSFIRLRPDREPRTCTYDQLDEALPAELSELLGWSVH